MTPLVVGVDVGGPGKGYHAVALSGVVIAGRLHTRDAREVAEWCIHHAATAVAVDAPCGWRRAEAPARAAERELAAARISCFLTPTRERARGHVFYNWMLMGESLYAALAPRFPLHTGGPPGRPVAFETFPHAVACQLAGEIVAARTKLATRTALLQRAGLATTAGVKIDDVDATLCALAAQHFRANRFRAFGDATDGYIIVPRDPLRA